MPVLLGNASYLNIISLLGIVVMLPLLNFMVTFLEKFIPQKTPEVDQPMYLSSASAEFPGTAVEAVRMETQRVYEAALRIIIDALGMKKTQVLSDVDLDQVVAEQSQIHKFDIDAMYERHVKGIYSAIVAFISETAFSRREESSAQLQWLREANTHLVEAIKDTEQLQENLIHYVGSENEKMREVYNRIRSGIAFIIRDLEETRGSGGGMMDVLKLDSLKLWVESEQNQFNLVITELVAKSAITPSMGSSLVNDSVFAHDIAMNLIRAAQFVFATADEDLGQAAQDVVLDKSDLQRIGEQVDTENSNG